MTVPIPLTYREKWDFSLIRGLHVPKHPSGHILTITGGQKGTTADGVHFDGAATSNIVVAANAGQNAKAACHITIRFKLDATFAAGAPGDFYLFQKLLAADDYLRIYLKAADGKLYWEQGNLAAGIQFTLTSTTVSWTAATWYIITVSLADTPAQRLLVNGTAEDTDTQAAVATPNGGNIVIGSSSDGGVDGVVGTISWVVMGFGATATVALIAAEEVDLSKGAPPPTAKVQHMYLMDEGRGVTSTDRGSLGVNGTLDSVCTWQYDQVRQPCFSVDGINDYATAYSVRLNGSITLVLVEKIKATYSGLSLDRWLCRLYTGADYMNIYGGTTSTLTGAYNAAGTFNSVAITPGALAIDSYAIFALTTVPGGALTGYFNGSQTATSPGNGIMPATDAYAILGALGAAGSNDISRPLWAALIERALSAAEVKALSRYLKDKMNLPISI